jgi:hypothetical protein
MGLEDSSDCSPKCVFALVLIVPTPACILASSHSPSSFTTSFLNEVASTFVNKLRDLKSPLTFLRSIFAPTLLTTPFATSWASRHVLTVKNEFILESHICTLSCFTLVSLSRPVSSLSQSSGLNRRYRTCRSACVPCMHSDSAGELIRAQCQRRADSSICRLSNPGHGEGLRSRGLLFAIRERVLDGVRMGKRNNCCGSSSFLSDTGISRSCVVILCYDR